MYVMQLIAFMHWSRDCSMRTLISDEKWLVLINKCILGCGKCNRLMSENSTAILRWCHLSNFLGQLKLRSIRTNTTHHKLSFKPWPLWFRENSILYQLFPFLFGRIVYSNWYFFRGAVAQSVERPSKVPPVRCNFTDVGSNHERDMCHRSLSEHTAA